VVNRCFRLIVQEVTVAKSGSTEVPKVVATCRLKELKGQEVSQLYTVSSGNCGRKATTPHNPI
jgi:hypothetical protein